MATVYRAPIEAPTIDFRAGVDVWRKQASDYIERVAAMARAVNGTEPLVGKVVRFQIADGYAEYIVWKAKPLQLVHLDLGDGYSIPPAHARGLRLADVKALVDFEQRWADLMAERKAAR